METFADIRFDYTKLAAARKGRSIAAVAREVGISRQLLWNYENKKGRPSADIIARLCRAYNIPIEDLTSSA